MSEQNNLDGLENAFRNTIEGQSLTLPPSVWQNLKIAALESQMAKHQLNNSILKGITGVLFASLIGTLFFINQKKEGIVKASEIVTIHEIDTLYITKVEKEYITVYKKIKENNQISDNSNKTETASLNNNLLPNSMKFIGLENENNKGKTNQKSSLVQLKNLESANFASNEKSENDIDNVKNISNSSESKVSENLVIVKLLKPTDFKTEHFAFKIPSLKIKSTQILISPNSIEITKEPLLNRFSITGYFMPELNTLDINRKEKQAFDYANEKVRNSSIIGLRGEYKLSPKLTLLAGIEHDQLSFDEFEKVQTFTAENINGNPAFVYRHALGSIIIPNSKLSSMPRTGDKLQVATNEPVSSFSIKPSIGLKINLLESVNAQSLKVKWNWKIYGILAANINLPLKHEIKLGIYQNNEIILFDINEIKNQRNFLGINLGFGVMAQKNKNLGLFLEPTFTHSLSSIVTDKSLVSHLKSIGIKFGLSYNFIKSKGK
jgi:hypothetical protein